jgi:hypothetical protein
MDFVNPTDNLIAARLCIPTQGPHRRTPKPRPEPGVNPKSIYYIEEKANVVGVGTDIKFKIFSGNVCGPHRYG